MSRVSMDASGMHRQGSNGHDHQPAMDMNHPHGFQSAANPGGQAPGTLGLTGPRGMPISTTRRAPTLPQLESPSHATPASQARKQLAREAATPGSPTLARASQGAGSNDFQFLVSASDFSPGPLVSPLSQRMLSESTSGRMHRADSATMHPEQPNEPLSGSQAAAPSTTGGPQPNEATRPWVMAPAPAPGSSQLTGWPSQAPGPIARCSMANPTPTSGAVGNGGTGPVADGFARITLSDALPPLALLQPPLPAPSSNLLQPLSATTSSNSLTAPDSPIVRRISSSGGNAVRAAAAPAAGPGGLDPLPLLPPAGPAAAPTTTTISLLAQPSWPPATTTSATPLPPLNSDGHALQGSNSNVGVTSNISGGGGGIGAAYSGTTSGGGGGGSGAAYGGTASGGGGAGSGAGSGGGAGLFATNSGWLESGPSLAPPPASAWPPPLPPPPPGPVVMASYLSRALGSWGTQGPLSYDPEALLSGQVGLEDAAHAGYRQGGYHGGPFHQPHHQSGSGSGNGQGHRWTQDTHHVIHQASTANSRASSLHQFPHHTSPGHHSGHGASAPYVIPSNHHNHHNQHNHHQHGAHMGQYEAHQGQQYDAQHMLGPAGLWGDIPGGALQQQQQQQRNMQPRLRASGRKREGSAWRELLQLLRLALPCVIITGSTQVVIVASQVLAGHLGTTALAAAALGNMLWLVGYYAIIGTCTALETLGAQAVGADDYGRLVVWDLAAGFTCTLLALPLAGALWNADMVAGSLLGQDDTISAVVVEYCRGLVPGLVPAVWAIILSKHMQAQSQVLLPALAAGSSAVVYVLVALPMVEARGLTGVSLAASVARVYQLAAMLLAVIAYESYKGTRWCSSRVWLRGMARWQTARRGRMLAKFLSLGAPGCLGAALESAGWEVTTAMAAYLGTLQVAVHASALSVATLVLMCVPMALAIAANIRVAQLLGSGHGQEAQLCARVVVLTGSVSTCLLGVLLYCMRDYLGWAFTSHDTAIVQLLADIAPMVAVYQAVAGLLGSTQGVLRGLGRQGTLVVNSSLGLGAGTLMGAWLTWGPRDMGLPGLWAGSIIGTTVTAVLNGLTLVLVEWQYEVHKARNMQSLQQGVRARQQMIYRALQADDVPDEALVEALLAEAQQDPRPLHIIYQEYAWFRGGTSMASTSMALTRAQSGSGAVSPAPHSPEDSQQQQGGAAGGGNGIRLGALSLAPSSPGDSQPASSPQGGRDQGQEREPAWGPVTGATLPGGLSTIWLATRGRGGGRGQERAGGRSRLVAVTAPDMSWPACQAKHLGGQWLNRPMTLFVTGLGWTGLWQS